MVTIIIFIMYFICGRYTYVYVLCGVCSYICRYMWMCVHVEACWQACTSILKKYQP